MSTPNASKKLINLLYSSTAPKISNAIPRLTKYLYEEDSSSVEDSHDFTLNKSYIQKKLPIQDALLSCWPKCETNILSFNCPNSFLTKEDFENLYPKFKDLKYFNDEKLDFNMLKRRNSDTLKFENQYYLLFNNQVKAAVYLKETEHKLLNGIKLNFKFQPINKTLLEIIRCPLKEGQQDLMNQILSVENNDVFATFKNYHMLKTLTNCETRNCSVLVNNLPFGLKRSTLLDKVLWGYEINEENPFKSIKHNINTETNIMIINFKNSKNAQKFIRNHHGKYWDSLQQFSRQKEKIFYNPLICEML